MSTEKINDVYNLCKEIDRVVSNFKKDGPSRKTISYFQRKREVLANLEMKLTNEDSEVRKNVKPEEDYEKALEQAGNLCKWMRNIINENLLLFTDYSTKNPEIDMETVSLESIRNNQNNQEDQDISFFSEEDGTQIDEDLKKLVKTQEGLLINLNQQIVNLNPTIKLRNEVKAFRIDRLKRTFEKIENMDAEIWSLAEHSKAFGYNHKLFFQAAAKVEDIIIQHESAINEDNESSEIRKISPKLPEISCPIFDGDFRQWHPFVELFKALIHSRKDISQLEKMVYLQQNLSGEALGLVRNLSLTEKNYEAALKLLSDRYSNEKMIVNAYLEQIFDQPNIIQQNGAALKGMHDNIKEALQALNRMNINTSTWSPILHFIVFRKLDSKTRILYETQSGNSKAIPEIDKLLAFIQTQFEALECINDKKGEGNKKNSLVVTRNKCPLGCENEHNLFMCTQFKEMKVNDRYEYVKNKNLCLNCLKSNHKVKDCKSRNCIKCGSKHNTLLHFERTVEKSMSDTVECNPNNNVSLTTTKRKPTKEDLVIENVIILATVMVILEHPESHKKVKCRAILDSASQVSFVSTAVFKKLGVVGSNANIEVEGIGHARKGCNIKTNLKITSIATSFSMELRDVMVLDSITSKHPNVSMNAAEFEIPETLTLADNEFYKSKEIGLLLGADIVGKALTVGNLSLGENKPSLQNTKFGWVVIGEILLTNECKYFCGIVTYNSNSNCSRDIKEFWESENGLSFSKIREKENRLCESLFKKTTFILNNGRFVVRLPFVKKVECLGSSATVALRRFLCMEEKLNKNKELKQEYLKFMKEYLELGHMEEVIGNRFEKKYYLPHHFVLKPDSTTTKLRVVFDAAAKTTSSLSLNDILAAGPKLQEDLFSIMVRFRSYRYAVSGDIKMMYRQILVHSDDQKFQLIFWRFDKNEPIKTYKLKTITYGTSSAPYLAVKCLKTLADQIEDVNPKAAIMISKDFYMDDLITGGDNLEELKDNLQVVARKLDNHGFHLRKWCANSDQLLVDFAEKDCETNLNSSELSSVKILGLHWKAKEDEIFVKINENLKIEHYTKRSVLAELASIFDPLGVLAPALIEAKLFIQDLWARKLDWDEPLSSELVERWEKFSSQLHYLNQFKFPRQIFCENNNKIEIHAFCDASKLAFGAVIYARSINQNKVSVNLICSKSRVVSLKKRLAPISMPRLELNAAVLLSQLVFEIGHIISKHIDEIYMYTDSTTVLHWINKDCNQLSPYVGKRIKIIQEKSSALQWKYVNSKNNPADIVSRGVTPKSFVNNEVWLSGPAFLKMSNLVFDNWANENLLQCSEENIKFVSLVSREIISGLGIDHKNKFDFLVNVLSYIIKFIYKKCNRKLEGLTWKEYAHHLVILDIQREFEEDKFELQKGLGVKLNSQIRTLSPFVDSYGLIRVGGRIDKASQLTFDARHPLLLSNKHPLTLLLVRYLHETHLHAGPQALLYILRQNYWLIRGRIVTKKIVNGCYRCFKANPRTLEQVMGNLPSDRLRPQRPFLVCGVDFIGPMKIHHKVRGRKPDKAYVCVFICFVTKAVHIEVVSDLSTNAFIAAFKRMIGRRGCPSRIYSDNGTNFKGAAREIEQNLLSDSLLKELDKRNIAWNFIPARSPHMGGIWEAAVRSIKKHYERMVQEFTLTFEQLQTLMIEIEAVLNSRPITPLSEDPNDLQVLCPAHFLIGEPLTSLPEQISVVTKIRDNWDGLTALKNDFWKRWSAEYLTELQKRYKWNSPQKDVEVGSLVLIKDENLPSLQWRRGRVIQSIKGDDGHVRVVELKTSNGVTKRSVHLIAPLPNEDYNKSNAEIDSKSNENTSFRNTLRENKRKPIKFSLCTVLLNMLLLAPLTVAQFNFENINDNSALFFEDLGESKVVKSQYNLVAYFDLNNYWTSKRGIGDAISHLAKACENADIRIRNQTSCTTITLQLARKWEQTEKLHRFIFHNQRPKRAVLKFVGGLLHDVIGILDEDTANEYNRKIEENKSDQQVVVNMVKELASLHNSTVNLIEENNSIILNELKDIRTTINNLNEMSNVYLFENSITKTLLAMEEFKTFQLAIWEAIRDVHSGIFNPTIIDPIQFQMALEKIRIHLPSSLTLPESTPLELYKVIKVRCSTSTNNIIFEIKIPLTGSEIFSLFHVHSFPVIYKNILINITPNIKYLLVNDMQDRYMEVANNNDRNCLKTNLKTKWLCSQISEIHHVKDSKSCEINLFLKRNFESLDHCNIYFTSQHEIIHKLTTGNNWLITEPSKKIFEMNCGSYRMKKQIVGRGILEIDPGCQARTSTSTIMALSEETSNITFVTSDIDWNVLLKANADIEIPHDVNISLPQLKAYPKAKPLAEYELPVHEIHQFAVGYSSLLLIVICIVGLLFLTCKFKGQIADLAQQFTATTIRSHSVPIFENNDI